MIYNGVIDSCILRTDMIKKALKALVGFPRCSSPPGKFCFGNEKVGKISIAALKMLDVTQDGNLRIRSVTKFDGNRTSCTIADLSVTRF